MSNNSSNKINVPEAKQAMNNFKMQAANEVGVNLKISSLTNPTNAANAIASIRQEKVNSALVSSYISHTIDAFLIRRSQRYDVKGKSYFNYPNKYYPTAREQLLTIYERMNIPAAIDLLLECRRTDDRYDLLRHTKKLLELYQKSGQQALRTWSPQRTLELCISLLKEEMDRSSERKMYRHTIAHLSNLHQYPDRPNAAHKLAQYWFAYHNNRPAMKDELRKAGYGEKK